MPYWMMVAGILIIVAIVVLYNRRLEHSSDDDHEAVDYSSDREPAQLASYTPGDRSSAIRYLISLGTQGTFPMTECLVPFAIQGEYKQPISELRLEEYDGAAGAIAMLGKNDLWAGDIANGRRKMELAAELALDPDAEITRRTREQVAEGLYNLGAVEVALITLLDSEQMGLRSDSGEAKLSFEIDRALSDKLGDFSAEQKQVASRIKAAMQWRMQYMDDQAALDYESAIAELALLI